MIILRDFLLKYVKENKIGRYTLVTYNGNTEAIWFSRYVNPTDKEDVSFVGFPCRLNKVCKTETDVDSFSREETGQELENCYEIEKFDVELYLPSEVDNIKIITEKECINWMLNSI